MFFRKKRQKVMGPYCVCIVPAAGSSSRMGGRDKLMAALDGRPVILHTLQALAANPYIHEIVIVTRSETLVDVGSLCRDARLEKVTQVLLGGNTRLESVYKGVQQIPKTAKLIAIHDAARPLVSQEVITAAVTAAARCAAAAPALPVKDTVKEVSGALVTSTLERATLRAVQTPQVFDADLLRAALQKAMDEGWELTDDCSAVERLGATVTLTPGDERNLKITTPTDLLVAEALLGQEG